MVRDPASPDAVLLMLGDAYFLAYRRARRSTTDCRVDGFSGVTVAGTLKLSCRKAIAAGWNTSRRHAEPDRSGAV